MNAAGVIDAVGVVPLATDPLATGDLAARLAVEHLVLDAFVGGRRRVDVQPLVLGQGAHAAAIAVAVAADRLARAEGDRRLAAGEGASRLGLPPHVARLAAASLRAPHRARFARVDLLVSGPRGARGDDGTFVACEVNADCPGGLAEAAALPGLARAHGARGFDPTRALGALVDLLAAAVDRAREAGRAPLVGLLFATGWSEDLEVALVVERALAARGIASVCGSPHAARASDRGVSVRGREVGVLYRFFPSEELSAEEAAAFEAAVGSGAVEAVASFAEAGAQSKLAMVSDGVGGDARGAFADAPSPFAPTFDLRDVPRKALVEDRAGWVLKRALGRVGEQVLVGALLDDPSFVEGVDEALACVAAGEGWVAQRFVPPAPVATPWGPRCLTLGVYVADGAFAGYFARLAPDALTAGDALVVPVLVAGGTPGGAKGASS